ncbi:hypothetical protein [Veronia pacifica]|uniref:Lipoprotein n=1 Tax=Veronia pacifica TaxID=1080227 RepID=A0A1C3EE34_9GAMM|nr:hypothetical protein [Veronia pacifica]ODA31517.1 hypothetical protein A8L45_16600 [Veronia pacifica]
MKKLLLILVLSISVIGCQSTSEEPEVVGPIIDILDYELKPTSLTLSQKNLFFETILYQAHERYRFEFATTSYERGDRTSMSVWTEGGIMYSGGRNRKYHYTSMDYYYIFKINKDNNITKETLNQAWHGKPALRRDCSLCSDHGFNKYIDELVNFSVREYNNNIDAYTTLINHVQNKTIDIKVSSKDKISADLESHIKRDTRFEVVPRKYNMETNIWGKPYIKVIKPLNYSGRIKGIKYSLSKTSIQHDESPSLDISVSSAYYDMKPKFYSTSDNSINASWSNGKLKIVNLTNNYIEIDSFSMYWGKNVSTLDNLNMSVPPQSEKTKYVSSAYTSDGWSRYENNPRFVKYENKNKKFPFGIAISYFNVDTNKRNTLFKKTDYSRANLD